MDVDVEVDGSAIEERSEGAPQSSNLIAGWGSPRDSLMEDIARHEERGERVPSARTATIVLATTVTNEHEPAPRISNGNGDEPGDAG